MVEALIESEQVCINVCNPLMKPAAREVLRGLRFERISFYQGANKLSHGAAITARFF